MNNYNIIIIIQELIIIFIKGTNLYLTYTRLYIHMHASLCNYLYIITYNFKVTL